MYIIKYSGFILLLSICTSTLAQDLLVSDFVICEKQALDYCKHLEALSLGDISAKPLLEEQWETISNMVNNDLARANADIEFRKYILLVQTLQGQTSISYKSNPITQAYYCKWKEVEYLLFSVRKKIDNNTIEEHILINGQTKKITNIFNRIPPYLKPKKIQPANSNVTADSKINLTKKESIESSLEWCMRMDNTHDDDTYKKEFQFLKKKTGSEFKARLGYLYRSGYGVKKDYLKAIPLFKKSADAGNAFGAYNLGYMYDYQYGKENGNREALKWYRKAAEQGCPFGQNGLGAMYYYGKGVKIDYKKAAKWYLKAAEQGYASSQYDLAYTYQFKLKNYPEALKWYRKAAMQGNVNSQCNLGIMYAFGNGVEQDYKEAEKWYRKAAVQGNANSQSNLGVMYTSGLGVEQDYEEAEKWFRKAAIQGASNGQNNLGYLYQYGYGVAKDYTEAVKWYQIAAEQGAPDGQYNLGEMYENGYGLLKDIKKAVEWYRKAAKQGHENSKNKLKELGL